MERTEILVREADRYAGEIQTSLRSAQGFVSIAIALLGLMASRGGLALLLAHIGLGIVLTYATQVFTDVLALGGYRRHLEEQINALVGTNTLSWERVIAPARRKERKSPLIVSIVFSIVFVGMAVPVQAVSHDLGLNYQVAHGVLFFAVLAGLIASRIEQHGSDCKALQLARNDYQDSPPPENHESE